MSQIVDQYLLFRIRSQRDPQAFAKLYDRYVAAIYRFVYLKVSSKEKAEDLTSETFLKAWEYVLTQPKINNARALFYQIAKNLVVDSYRRDGVRQAVETVVTFQEAGASTDYEREFSDGRRGQRRVEAQVETELLLARISRLKEDFQDVLTLRLVEDLPFGDIAAVLGKTPGNVRVIYHRAIKALEEMEDRRQKTDYEPTRTETGARGAP